MWKIKDRLALAAVTSLIGVWPSRILGRQLYQRNVIDFDFDELGAGMFLNSRLTRTVAGRLTGIAATEVNNLVASIVLTYILSATGRDKAALKGLGVGVCLWVFVNGLLAGSILRKKSARPWTPLFTLLHHALSGTLSALVASNIGDDSLFPDRSARDQQGKLPIVPLGIR